MTIIEALRNPSARVVYGNKWIYFSPLDNKWVVMLAPKRYGRNSITLLETTDEELAVEELLKEN